MKLYRWIVNPPTDSGPTSYFVFEENEEEARREVLMKCRERHKNYIYQTPPQIIEQGDVISI